MIHTNKFLPKTPPWLALHGKSLIFRHLDYYKMRFLVFICELHSPINYLWIRTNLIRANKSICCFHHWVQQPYTNVVSWILLSHVCQARQYCFGILRICTLVLKTFQRHNFTSADRVDFSTRMFLRHTSTHLPTHPHTHLSTHPHTNTLHH